MRDNIGTLYNCAIGLGLEIMNDRNSEKLNRRGAEIAEVRELSYGIIGAAMEVHKILGAGFLESVYGDALAIELEHRHIPFQREVEVSVNYKGKKVGVGRLDFLVDEIVIVELKAVESLRPIHDAQLISYLKMTKYPLGLLINFNVPLLKEGIHRLILSQ
jgi:GxxExxY protein